MGDGLLQPAAGWNTGDYKYKMMNHIKEMTSGATLPLIFNFTIPVLLGSLLQQTYSLVDAAIVGQCLGINALAAVGASSSVIFLILGFCNGCCGGFGIPVAQKFGAHHYEAMRRLVFVGSRLSLFMSVGLALMTSLLCSSILQLMQTPQLIFEDAYHYLLITFIGIPATFFYNLYSSIIRALGDSKTPFLFLVLTTVLNILLDFLFIIVFGWGVPGAAIATVTAQAVSALLCRSYMYRHYAVLQLQPNERRFSFHLARVLLTIGAPMGLQFSITAIGCIMLQSSNNALGTACVAAYTTAIRIEMFFLCMLESIGITMATFCGQNYGAGKPERIWQGVKSASVLALGYIVPVVVILWLFSESIATWFVDASQHEIIDMVAYFLHVIVSFFPFLGLLCILRYSIQGVGYTSLALFSGVAEMVARALVALFAVPQWGFGVVCLGDVTAWIFAVLFLVPAFRHVYRNISAGKR